MILLDCLINEHSNIESALTQSIKNNIENILNTYAVELNCIKEWSTIKNSTLSYGIPNIFYLDFTLKTNQDYLCQIIQTAIMAHEPRLTDVTVVCQHDSESHSSLPLQIEAVLIHRNRSFVVYEPHIDLIQHRMSFSY